MRRCTKHISHLAIRIAAFVVIAASLPIAAATLNGAPPVDRFAPDIDVTPQNFCVTQDSRGIIFVCNTDGILEFDAERWKLWSLPNNEIVRSLAVGADDTVYVGGYNTFGWLKREATGVAVYQDVSALFKTALAGREFADIWQTVITPEGIYYRALRDLFFWDPKTNTTAHWYHETRFGVLYHHQGKTVAQFRGDGFKVREGAAWRLLPGLAAIKAPVFQAVSLADSSVLVFGPVAGWYKIANESASVPIMPLGTPAPSLLARMAVLVDSSIAMTTSDGRVFIIDQALQKVRAIDVEAGYISGVTNSRDSAFFVSSDRAVHRVAWPPTWSVINTELTNIGSLHQVRQWNGEYFALTSSGTYRIVKAADGAEKFEQMAWHEQATHDPKKSSQLVKSDALPRQ
jgi:hypothetical protein